MSTLLKSAKVIRYSNIDRVEIVLDFTNDKHHLAMLDKSMDNEDVARALRELSENVLHDQDLV